MGERKPTRREVFLQVMERVIPWNLLLKAIAPYYPKAGPQGGRPAYPIKGFFHTLFMKKALDFISPIPRKRGPGNCLN